MANKTSIEWCDATFNPWWGCTKVSPGCDHCYAETLANRFGTAWGTDATRRTFGDKHWNEPLRWNAKAERAHRAWDAGLALAGGDEAALIAQGFDKPRRPRVFCASMADVFDKDAPEGARVRLWALIEATPHLDWLLLTKRIGNVSKMIPVRWSVGLPNNVWLGISVVNQDEADRDIEKLLAIKARVRFISCEPLLGPLDLQYPDGLFPDGPRRCCNGHECGCMGQPIDPPMIYGINWVICGGESGDGARPMRAEWAQSLRNQCAAAGVPFLFKQWGNWLPFSQREDQQFASSTGLPANEFAWNLPKKIAGRLLDGVRHDGYPVSTGPMDEIIGGSFP